MKSQDRDFDVVVIGAGPAGLAAGLACAELGLRTAVAGPEAFRNDARSAALFHGSIQFLKRVGVWPHVESVAEPLAGIRLIDATGGFFRAPEVMFRASEIGLEAFGYSLLNRDITAGMEAAAAGRLHRIVSSAVTIEGIAADAVTLSTREGERFSASLVAAADGRASAARTAAGIDTTSWTYDQAAVVCNLQHTRPHHQISTEWHRRAGPLTLVPAPIPATGQFASSLVWVETPSEARRLAALDDAAFGSALTQHIGGFAGQLSNITPRQAFPLSGQTATALGKNRVALIGEAGHVIPPIGAQGLNLSLRDAATLADEASAAKTHGNDPGGDGVLSAYDRARWLDVTSRIYTVDLLNRSLLSSLSPVHLTRGLGLFGLHALPFLRRLLMREGVAPALSTPSLMRDLDAPVHTASGLDGATSLRA